MRIVFLDIDGVLWIGNPPEGMPVETFRPAPVIQLNRIIKALPDLQIVISSSWRHYHSLEWLREHFQANGIDAGRIIGITPSLRSADLCRGEEIALWVSKHLEVTDFVIVDDDSDMEPLMDRLFQTKFQTGLTPEIADRILWYLNRERK